jgi:hypothetical protein
MLDLTTLGWVKLILLELSVLPETMTIGCTTAGAGVLSFYPVRQLIWKNSAVHLERSGSRSTGTRDWSLKKIVKFGKGRNL